MLKFRLSRYWNRFAYSIVDFGYLLIWDSSKCNQDRLKLDKELCSSTREILTTFFKYRHPNDFGSHNHF